MYCPADWRSRSQKEAVQSGRPTQRVRELYLARTHLKSLLNAPIVRHTDGSPASGLRLRLASSLQTIYKHLSHDAPQQA